MIGLYVRRLAGHRGIEVGRVGGHLGDWWDRLCGLAYVTGAISGVGTTFGGAEGYQRFMYLDWSHRPYVLWRPSREWRCLLRYHHRPIGPWMLGHCAKCLQCSECGSLPQYDDPLYHLSTCAQYEDAA